ncbi:MAG: ribosomal protein S18-alanine N-acetyltransferase [Bacilli bacterium]|nr:ribosomal protein S18-alanine N-acetyltransferase [Bacilli bacterium]
MIREYGPDDIIFIEEIAKILDSNYKFKINPFTKCLLYEENKVILGFVTYFVMYEKAEITDIAVKIESQHQQIGSKLLNKVIEECTNNKCESLTLEVRASNETAISFYKGKGFRESSVRKNYYSNGEDALLMIMML